jgi:hypothetical protein
MADARNEANQTADGWDSINHLYDVSVTSFGNSLEFRLFDVQYCENLQIDWLAGAVAHAGIDRKTLDSLIRDGLVRTWKDVNGTEGYILYSEYLARQAATLRQSGRYSLDEQRHIFDDWHSFLEIVTSDELAYDSLNVDDYEHFRRRAGEMVQLFTEQLERTNDGPLAQPAEHWEEQQEENREKLQLWQRVNKTVQNKSDSQLSPAFKGAWRKQLFQLRWADEWVRLMTAQDFSTLIEQGYSPEVSFNGHHYSAGVLTLQHLNWPMTLRRLKDTRNEGLSFPLRTPDFNVTERGIEYLKPMTPGEYQAIYEQYHLDQLHALLSREGAALWTCDLAASGRAACEECGGIFERTTASRRFCSTRCLNRNKGRRWRASNPDLSRQAQARYYRDAYPEIVPPGGNNK